MRRDFDKAVSLYRAAAEQGDTWAQYLLGLCYRDGEGVKASRRWARHWFTKAATVESEAAKELRKVVGDVGEPRENRQRRAGRQRASGAGSGRPLAGSRDHER